MIEKEIINALSSNNKMCYFSIVLKKILIIDLNGESAYDKQWIKNLIIFISLHHLKK